MSSSSIILEKSLDFAAKIVRHNALIRTRLKWRVFGSSKADFIAKLQISLKETAETECRIRLLIKTDYINEQEGNSLLNDCLEIKRILISSLKTAKETN